MVKSKTRRGRPLAVHRPKIGDPVVGLMRLGDGRWRASGPEKYTFSEPDEQLAIAHFRAWQAKKSQPTLGTLKVHPTAEAALVDIATRTVQAGGSLNVTLEHSDEGDARSWAVADETLSPAQWAWLRRQIIDRPKWIAERLGIEQIAYLTDLKKPTVSPSLIEVGDLYFNKAKISEHWRVKCRGFWQEFREAVAVPTLRDVTQEAVADYKADVLEAAESPTYAKHRFGAVKTILGYSKEWGKWSEDRSKALAFCSILIPPTSTSLDPRPIDPAEFQALLKKADDQMKAILMLALNACLYAKDVADLRPNDLDLEKRVLIADRGKTSVARVATLWPATVAAIRKLDVKDGVLFRTGSSRQAHNANTIRKAFRDLRRAAELSDDVQFAHIRDGAFTCACEGEGVQYEHARVLAGHRSGVADNYVKRRPGLVGAACEAIRVAYGIPSE